ncbi:MAG: hypothetical protein M3314_15600 [Actinomycetota bacterium]|nr:hypothetical protein [Actinomycetota bacterium]
MTATMTRSVQGDVGEPIPARPRWAVLAMVGGLLLTAGAAAILVASVGRTTGLPAPAAPSFPTVGTSATAYLPGHSSGWHVHPGLHSVVVLSGTLTIYDENCVRTEYGPGHTYLGGSAPHVARNEASDVLDVAITFVYRSTSEHGSAVAAPGGCDLR